MEAGGHSNSVEEQEVVNLVSTVPEENFPQKKQNPDCYKVCKHNFKRNIQNNRKSKTMFSCGDGIFIINVVLFLYKTGESMMDATIRPYLIRSVCHKFLMDIGYTNGTVIVCSRLEEFPELEDDVQRQSGYYLMYYRLLLNVPVIVISMFCGSYSDKYGRKPTILLPCVGSMFAAILYMAGNLMPEFRIHFVIGGATMQGICGKSSMITMAANSIVFDLSNTENRTRLYGILLAMDFFGGTLGALLSGIFQDVLDLNVVFASIMISYFISIILTMTLIKESKESDKTNQNPCNVFQIHNVKETVGVILKPRSHNNRTILIILIIMSVVNQLCRVGETDVKIMFTTRSPFSWSNSWIGYLLSCEYAVMGLSLILFMPLFANRLKLQDGTIIVIGLISGICKLTFLSFSTKSWMIFVSVGIGLFMGMTSATLRSLLSKTVSKDEAGKMFSILSCGETIAKFLGTLVFVNIYNETAHIFRGMAFMIEAAIYLLLLAVVFALLKKLKSLQSTSENSTVVIERCAEHNKDEQIEAQPIK